MALTKVKGSVWDSADNGLAVNVKDFGAVGDGEKDDGNAWAQAINSLPSTGGTIRGVPGDTYLIEGQIDDPYVVSTSSIGVLIKDKNNVHIDLTGCIIKQTSATTSTTGVFVFANSTNCSLFGGFLDGYYDGVTTSAGAMVGILGACDKISVNTTAGLSRGVAVLRSSDGTSSGSKPTNTHIKGTVTNGEYGVNYTHCGYGHIAEINAKNHLRSLFITGTPGINASVNSVNGGGPDVNISTRDGGDVYDINIVLNSSGATQPVYLGVSDSTACNITNVAISGTVRDSVNDSVVISKLGHIDTTIKSIDLSDLRIVNAGSEAVYIAPDVAATISGIKLGDMQAKANVLQIDNTIGATISNIQAIGKTIEHNVSPAISANVIVINGGIVSDVNILNCIFDSTTTGGVDVSITTADGLTIDGCVSKTGKEIYVVGSVNVKPGLNDHLNRGFIRSGALTNGLVVSWADTLICTTGTASVSSLNRAVPGQKLTLAFTTGTQTIVEGANMLLNGTGDFVATAGDTITLVCVDPPSGGPLATSTWQELCRSVN